MGGGDSDEARFGGGEAGWSCRMGTLTKYGSVRLHATWAFAVLWVYIVPGMIYWDEIGAATLVYSTIYLAVLFFTTLGCVSDAIPPSPSYSGLVPAAPVRARARVCLRCFSVWFRAQNEEDVCRSVVQRESSGRVLKMSHLNFTIPLDLVTTA